MQPGEEDLNGTLMFKWWGVAAGSSTESLEYYKGGGFAACIPASFDG